jgi:catechol 2,3-dioxygenase-like lactoylglutathione lyase family enzyme
MLSSDPCVRPQGVHHVGVVVSDLEVSTAFYEEMFGAKEVLRVDHDELSLVFLEFPNTLLELLVYRDGARDSVPRESDLGAGHFALQVDDVIRAQAELEARGVRFQGPALRIQEGPSAGYVLTFALDPDGNRVELIQPPL